MATTKKPITRKTTSVPKKAPVASEKKVVATKSGAKEVAVQSSHSLSATVVGVDGSSKGKATLPAELFDVKVPHRLLAQAVRVHLANQRAGNASTKTRGEVEGSTRKIYKQKGTGRARHGGIRAPIFVGGGISFGPKPRDYRLQFPKQLRNVALAGALSYQLHEGNILVVDGISAVEPKTKAMMNIFMANKIDTQKLLIVLPKGSSEALRALRNIDGVTIRPANNLNAHDVLWHNTIVFSKDALPLLKETYV